MADQVFEIRFGGLGGQGVITAAKVFGDALAMEGYNVLQTQSYGIEARGGYSCGEVIYGKGEVNKLRVTNSDVLLALSESAIHAYAKTAKPGSYVFYDSYLIKEVPAMEGLKVFSAPFTEIAMQEMGNELYTNLIATGFINKITGLVSQENLEAGLLSQIKGNKDNNLKALHRGAEEAAR